VIIVGVPFNNHSYSLKGLQRPYNYGPYNYDTPLARAPLRARNNSLIRKEENLQEEHRVGDLSFQGRGYIPEQKRRLDASARFIFSLDKENGQTRLILRLGEAEGFELPRSPDISRTAGDRFSHLVHR